MKESACERKGRLWVGRVGESVSGVWVGARVRGCIIIIMIIIIIIISIIIISSIMRVGARGAALHAGEPRRRQGPRRGQRRIYSNILCYVIIYENTYTYIYIYIT